MLFMDDETENEGEASLKSRERTFRIPAKRIVDAIASLFMLIQLSRIERCCPHGRTLQESHGLVIANG